MIERRPIDFKLRSFGNAIIDTCKSLPLLFFVVQNAIRDDERENIGVK